MTARIAAFSLLRLATRLHPFAKWEYVTRRIHVACVAGVKRERGRGNLGAREHVGCARGKGKERLQGRHCFLHFSRSDSELENSDWSELIKCQSSTYYLFPIG